MSINHSPGFQGNGTFGKWSGREKKRAEGAGERSPELSCLIHGMFVCHLVSENYTTITIYQLHLTSGCPEHPASAISAFSETSFGVVCDFFLLFSPWAEALPSLIEIFHELDADKSGHITHDEVENVPVPSLVFRQSLNVKIPNKMGKSVNLFPEVSILPPRVLDALCVENIADIFDYLDVDGTGELSQVEFVEGLLQLCLLDT